MEKERKGKERKGKERKGKERREWDERMNGMEWDDCGKMPNGK